MGSRVANNPVPVPGGVDITIDGQLLKIKGKQGELSHTVNSEVNVDLKDNVVNVAAKTAANSANALAGTTRALVSNMVVGVSEGFKKVLVMKGVGYRAQVQGSKLNLTVGMSHPVIMEMPQGINVETPAATEIVVSGANKQVVCQIAANIRAVRPPEPYKGKGIRYKGEHVALKEGKKK